MNFFKEIIGKIFADKKTFSVHKENFALSASDEDKVKIWMDSEEGRSVFKGIHTTYHLHKLGIKEEPGIHLLSSPYASGMAITFEYPLGEKTFSNLFFALGFSMLDLGYYRVSLDRTLKETTGVVKITEKQYFKPAVPAFGQKIDQRFGNISIEKELVDGRFSFLKVLAMVYSSRHYHRAGPFDQFIGSLLNR